MSKRIPGLYKRGTQGIWHIDKCVRGYGRLHESTTHLYLEIYRRFEEAGIVISFPQRDVHLDSEKSLA